MTNRVMKRIKKSCFVAAVGMMIAGATLSANAEQPVETSQYAIEAVQPKADDIGWVFKEVNGQLYRRLYNFTTQEYIGDWILCE